MIYVIYALNNVHIIDFFILYSMDNGFSTGKKGVFSWYLFNITDFQSKIKCLSHIVYVVKRIKYPLKALTMPDEALSFLAV